MTEAEQQLAVALDAIQDSDTSTELLVWAVEVLSIVGVFHPSLQTNFSPRWWVRSQSRSNSMRWEKSGATTASGAGWMNSGSRANVASLIGSGSWSASEMKAHSCSSGRRRP